MRYEIKDNAIYGYNNSQQPFMYQPNHPDNNPWVDEAEMTAWAELWLAHMTDPENNPFPADR